MKNLTIWVAVNKNSFVNLFINEPQRNNDTCKWVGDFFINSLLYNQFKDMVEKSNMNWLNEPEPFTINLK